MYEERPCGCSVQDEDRTIRANIEYAGFFVGSSNPMEQDKFSPNVNALYGPYPDRETAHASICRFLKENGATEATIPAGLTVGVYDRERGKVNEYWYEGETPKGGYTVRELVAKSQDAVIGDGQVKPENLSEEVKNMMNGIGLTDEADCDVIV